MPFTVPELQSFAHAKMKAKTKYECKTRKSFKIHQICDITYFDNRFDGPKRRKYLPEEKWKLCRWHKQVDLPSATKKLLAQPLK